MTRQEVWTGPWPSQNLGARARLSPEWGPVRAQSSNSVGDRHAGGRGWRARVASWAPRSTRSRAGPRSAGERETERKSAL